jgi:hypothetical protein
MHEFHSPFCSRSEIRSTLPPQPVSELFFFTFNSDIFRSLVINKYKT